MQTIRQLDIFVSSPDDVGDERNAAREIVDRLNADPEWRDILTLKAHFWDAPTAPVPMDAGVTPQTSVNRYLTRPSKCDLTIIILWGRLGTRVADEWRADGTRYESGTVWELEDALTANRPVFIFRNEKKIRSALDSPTHHDKATQWKAVHSFLKRFTNTDGSLNGGLNGYKSLEQFRRKFETALRAFIADFRRTQHDLAPAHRVAELHHAPRRPYLVPDKQHRLYDVVRRNLCREPNQGGASEVERKLPADDVTEVWQRVSEGHNVCLNFLPGVGKSTLAEEVVNQRELVLTRFEGVLWADVGQRPELLVQFRKWAESMNVPTVSPQAASLASVDDVICQGRCHGLQAAVAVSFGLSGTGLSQTTPGLDQSLVGPRQRSGRAALAC